MQSDKKKKKFFLNNNKNESKTRSRQNNNSAEIKNHPCDKGSIFGHEVLEVVGRSRDQGGRVEVRGERGQMGGQLLQVLHVHRVAGTRQVFQQLV